jgi:hypothetical protein
MDAIKHHGEKKTGKRAAGEKRDESAELVKSI